MLAVNYQGLVPVLINALKEQQSEIDVLKEQESKYLEQEKRLERLEKLVAQLDQFLVKLPEKDIPKVQGYTMIMLGVQATFQDSQNQEF